MFEASRFYCTLSRRCVNWRAYYDIAEWTGMKINEVATAAERSWSLERDTTRRQPFSWRKALNRHAYNVRLFYMYASFVWDVFRFTVGYRAGNGCPTTHVIHWKFYQLLSTALVVGLNPIKPTVAIMGTAIKHPVPDRVKPSFVIFDIRALWRSGLSVRVPGCQKLQMTA